MYFIGPFLLYGTMSATGIVISLIFLFDMQYRCVHMAAHGAHNYAIIVHCGVGCRNYKDSLLHSLYLETINQL